MDGFPGGVHRADELPSSCLEVGPGRVSATFLPGDPTLGAKELHKLSLAMLNDWNGFVRMAGIFDPSWPDRAIDPLSEELEALKRQGVESL